MPISSASGSCSSSRSAASSPVNGSFTTATSRGSLRLGDDADVRLRGLPVAEDLLGLVVGDGAGDDDVLALLPVHGCGHLVVGGELQGVDDPQHLVEVAARGHRIDE